MSKIVLKEIKTADAYQRFYSDVDANVYSVITFGSKNLLNISKFVLDYFKKSGGEYTPDVIEKIRKIGEVYKKLGNQSQIEVNDKAKNGMYGTFEDLYEDLVNREESVTKISGLQYGKNGLIILMDDEDACITCTPTYESSVKNFGHTKWCTASDMFGRYNGYFFFTQYIFHTVGMRLEFETPPSDLEMAKMYIDAAREKGAANALIQVKLKENDYLFQLQIDLETGSIMTVCDSYDREMEEDDFIDCIAYPIRGGIETLDKLVSDNKELIKQSIFSTAEAEYAKVKKLNDNAMERANAEAENILQTADSVVKNICQSGNLYDFYRKLDVIDDDTDEWVWVNNLRFVCTDSITFDGEAYYIFTFFLGGNSKNLNQFMFRNAIGAFVTILFKNQGELIAYRIDQGNGVRCGVNSLRVIDGEVYCVVSYGTKKKYIYDSKLNLIGKRYFEFIWPFEIHSVHQPHLERPTINGRQNTYVTSDNMSIYYTTDRHNLVDLGNYNFVGIEYEENRGKYTMVRTDGKTGSFYGSDLEMNCSRSSAEDVKRFFEDVMQGKSYKINSNDVAAMVRECIERIFNSK